MVKLLLLCLCMMSASIRLYLKDGSVHEVSEYKVQQDRVRYYSIERSDWEEIPLELVDLKKTEAEIKARTAADKAEDDANREEEEFEKKQRQEIASIPSEAGLYQVEPTGLRKFPAAEIKVRTPKGRSILKVITPIPIVAGKSYVELDGEQSKNVVTDARPEFYFRLADEERFGIAKVKVMKNVRQVEVWNIVPVTNEIFSEREMVDVFRQQLKTGLYKIWPTKPLEPGEYAMIEYTEGKANTQVWDFRISK